MEHTAFFVVGIVLVIAALGVSFTGLRFESFPSSRALLAGGIGLFAVLVLATTTAAVFNARDEQEQREAEQAEEASAEEQSGEESASAEQTGAEGPSGASVQEQEAAAGGGQQAGQAPSGGGGETLKLTSPDDGSTSFDPSDFEAKAGTITIDYTNPSPVQHDVAIARDDEVLDEGDLVTDGDVSTASADLDPGEYVYYCTVPGHREAGMEGTLTVK